MIEVLRGDWNWRVSDDELREARRLLPNGQRVEACRVFVSAVEVEKSFLVSQ